MFCIPPPNPVFCEVGGKPDTLAGDPGVLLELMEEVNPWGNPPEFACCAAIPHDLGIPRVSGLSRSSCDNCQGNHLIIVYLGQAVTTVKEIICLLFPYMYRYLIYI